MLAVLLLCSLRTSHATYSTEPEPTFRVFGEVVITTPELKVSETIMDKAGASRLLQKRWEEKTDNATSKIWAFLSRWDHSAPTNSKEKRFYKEAHRVVIRYQISGVSKIGLDFLNATVKFLSQIKPIHSSVGDIRWKAVIRNKVTQEPS
jgi:hypothetical protein